MELQWTLFPWRTLVYLLLWLLSASGKQLCNETWCQISPQYTTKTIREGESEQIICAIPDLPGSSVQFVNQFGKGIVRTRRDLTNYVSFTRLGPSLDNITRYQLNISWTQDRLVHEQLRMVQCIANFLDRTNPCRTSVVFIDFEVDSKPDVPTQAMKSKEQVEELMMSYSPLTCRLFSTSRTMSLILLLLLVTVIVRLW